jgi:Chaperone of endosialidase
MKYSIQLKITAFVVWATAALTCLGLLPNAQATDTESALPFGNTADGIGVLTSLTTGVWNSGFGFEALNQDTSGSLNTATGLRALFNNTEGNANTANGMMALFSNTTGFGNVAIGAQALVFNTDGANNTAAGVQALFRNTTGSNNTATGLNALYSNTTGIANTANGSAALYSNTTGIGNAAYGIGALEINTTGENNTAIGGGALFSNTGGSANTVIGAQASVVSTGSFNTVLGFEAGNSVITANNVIVVGAQVDGANVNNSCFIGNIRGVTTQNANAIPVLIDSAGQLGTMSSSARFKTEIKPMDKASEAILALKPVTFHYKSDASGIPQFGLIAEEVAEVNPDLVVRDENGEIYTVRYDAVNAMLLNEFLKEHRRVEQQQATIQQLKSNAAKQEATISELKRDLGVFTAQLKEQAAQIQKVSAQIEMKEQARHTVANK